MALPAWPLAAVGERSFPAREDGQAFSFCYQMLRFIGWGPDTSASPLRALPASTRRTEHPAAKGYSHSSLEEPDGEPAVVTSAGTRRCETERCKRWRGCIEPGHQAARSGSAFAPEGGRLVLPATSRPSRATKSETCQRKAGELSSLEPLCSGTKARTESKDPSSCSRPSLLPQRALPNPPSGDLRCGCPFYMPPGNSPVPSRDPPPRHQRYDESKWTF